MPSTASPGGGGEGGGEDTQPSSLSADSMQASGKPQVRGKYICRSFFTMYVCQSYTYLHSFCVKWLLYGLEEFSIVCICLYPV